MKDEENKNKKSDAALREEAVLKFWKENKVFEKSIEREAPRGNYVFYDGPPFATGVPHYGHILGSTVKDVIGRYQTMRGFRVPRRWGWDCHGLPIENIVEKDLGISGRKEIEELGIEKFTGHARSQVLTFVAEWKKTVNRMGRWVDFDNSFKTMDNTFIESVWWALGELHKKNLLYEGVRVLAYCPRCETPIANSEIAMDNSYKDITDISVYVKFKLVAEDNTYLLAWTTTPWTLPGNTAIAVNKDLSYFFVKHSPKSGEEIIILAKDRFEGLEDKFKNPEIIKEVQGGELIGLSYEPVFDYYKNVDIPNKENIWKVWHADFVMLDMGTGIAHEAPAFGEDDMTLAQKNNIPLIRHVEPNGDFVKEVTDFVGVKVKPKEDHQSGDVLIIKYLAGKGSLFAKEKIIHSYPHCYRCETPLLYYALPSWFVNISKVKNDILEKAKEMNWIPRHLKNGRFHNIMESAPDWTISRNRYWASPLPIWKSESGKIMFVNSLEDLKKKTKKSSNKYIVMRHGQAENNFLKIYSSDRDKHHLTEKGRQEVLNAIENLKNKNITKIFASPYLRTRETAEIIAEKIHLSKDKVIFDERIREYEFGEFSGRSMDDFADYIKDKSWDFNFLIPGGERFQDGKNRAGDFLYDIDSKNKNEVILIITHGLQVEVIPSIIEGADKKRTLEIFYERGQNKTACIYPEQEFVPLPHNENYELDMHRPYIDAIVLVDEEGAEYRRIPEVIDCWFESGSMPFAQDHYPFENPEWQKNNFPAGFVAEYIAQTRTWFYYTHVISTILFNHAPFENVVTTGTLLAEDGSKMSKSKNNFPDPFILFDKYGVDALRLYLMASPLMKGEDISFSEKSVQEIHSKVIGRLFNVVAFYELYRDVSLEARTHKLEPNSNVLDFWVLSRLNQVINEVTKGMEGYDMTEASRPLEVFIDDLSTWYLRRSRERLKEGNEEAKRTLYFVLKNLAKIIAPIMPFTAEDVWLKLKNKDDAESVHLSEWPKSGEIDLKILEDMLLAREICTIGNAERQRLGIPVRQPLHIKDAAFGLLEKNEPILALIRDELNVKEIVFNHIINKNIPSITFDTNITPELKQEGNYRELVRALQDERKKEGLMPSDVITLSISTDEKGQELIQEFRADLLKTVGVGELKTENNDGVEIKIDELVFRIKIKRA